MRGTLPAPSVVPRTRPVTTAEAQLMEAVEAALVALARVAQAAERANYFMTRAKARDQVAGWRRLLDRMP